MMKADNIHKGIGLLLLFVPVFMSAQNKSNKGKEFWLGYGHNVLFTQGPPVNSQTQVIYLSAEQPANVTVSVNGTGWSRTVSIPANTVDFSVVVPKTGPEDARILSEGKFTKGIHILSDTPIVAYAHQHGITSSGATLLMPVETYGYTYYSLNYTQVSNMSGSYSWFYVIAAEDNTRVQIIPSDSTQAGWLPGQSYVVNLNKGELYNVFGKSTGVQTGKDMSGSKIISINGADGNCHPVAVFSGSSRNTICNGNGGEVIQQQIFPANAWGTKYLTYHTVTDLAATLSIPFLNYYRVAVRNPATVVKRNGIPLTGLVNNFYYEFSSTGGDYIEADQPILVAQYLVSENQCAGSFDPPVGDPEMIYLSPIEQGVKNVYFYSTRNQYIDLNFINIIIPQSGLASLRIDGNAPAPSEYITHPAQPGYAVVGKRLPGAAAQHHIQSDSSFIASVYGLGFYESYGYNMGTFVNNLNARSHISNTLSIRNRPDSFTCPNSPFRLTLQLAFKVQQIHWKLSQLAGLIPAADSVINNPVPADSGFINNRKYYTYTLQQDFRLTQAGRYFIPVTYTAPDIDACNQTETATIEVIVKPGPLADFSFSSPACTADTIQFTGQAQANGHTIHSYYWQFADNSNAAIPDTRKYFATAGNQAVYYRVLTENGCVDDTVKTVAIHANPSAGFTLSKNDICAGESIQAQSSLTGTGQWNWDFGIGSSSATPPVTSPVYNSPGLYRVRLQVSSAEGCLSDTATESITVYPQPVVNAGRDTVIKAGTPVQLQGSVIPAGIYQFNWTPSNSLSNGLIANPIAAPHAGTQYQLTVTDPQSGCFAQDEVTVTVIAGLFIPTGFTPNGDGKNDTWAIPGLALYPGARVAVFNRDGQKVYESNASAGNAWNGTYKGQPQPAGVYIYLVQWEDGSKPLLKGTLALIR